jgi:hypothetical protein
LSAWQEAAREIAVAGQVEHAERLKTQEVSFTSEGTKVPDCFAHIELGTDETQVREPAAQLRSRSALGGGGPQIEGDGVPA